jgi:hypothetical protein
MTAQLVDLAREIFANEEVRATFFWAPIMTLLIAGPRFADIVWEEYRRGKDG